MTVQTKPLAQITAEAIRILCREIGAADTARFINQFTTGFGNYSEEREQLFKDMTMDDVIAAIKARRQSPYRSDSV
jgi:hypothetical protein